MALFKVTNIIDGNTITVDGWKWNNYTGKSVKIVGYNVNGENQNTFAKSKLEILLKEKSIELKNVQKAEFSIPPGNDTIYCEVFLNDINIAQYFPELTTTT